MDTSRIRREYMLVAIFGYIAFGGMALLLLTAIIGIWLTVLTDIPASMADHPFDILLAVGVTLALPFGLLWILFT